MNASEILEQLTEAYAQRDLLHLAKDDAQDKIITPEIKAALVEIDMEFEPKEDAIAEKIAQLEAQAKQAVILSGATAKGGALQAVYMKGRVTWDNKKLDGMMILVPQLKEARKEGEPSVSIRKIG